MDDVKVLDHGYVRLVDVWGSDQRVIEAARTSTQKGFLGWGPKCRACGDCFDGPERPCPEPAGREYVDAGRGGHVFTAPGDEKLLKFLWDNAHATPFEMAGLTIEVKAPIMVFREWHRHRVPFGYSEASARYVPLPNENYVPDSTNVVARATLASVGTNRQAAGTSGKVPTYAEVEEWLRHLEDAYSAAQSAYTLGLELGIPKELARLSVPVGRYSVMRATSNLRGWLGFLKLRAAPTAQQEIRVYAKVVADLVRTHFPRTHAVAAASLGLPA